MELVNLQQKQKLVFKILGEKEGNLVFTKLKNEIQDLTIIPNKDMLNVVYAMCNYVDSNETLNYNKLDELNLNNIKTIWVDFLEKFKINYFNTQYTEKNKIILDYRKNKIGHYWVDLEKLFCIESMVRMEDCGRVNYGHTTLELREQTTTSNVSHMIIVYEIETGNIRQVKGKGSLKPDVSKWEYFYRFLIETGYKINEYSPTYKPETDLTVSQLTLIQKRSIYNKHPTLNQLKHSKLI